MKAAGGIYVVMYRLQQHGRRGRENLTSDVTQTNKPFHGPLL